MRPPSPVSGARSSLVAALLAVVAFTQGCTSYVPVLGRLAPDDRIRIASPSPFHVLLAGRDRVPTGSCDAIKAIGRILEIRGDTLVLGGSPRVVPAPGAACELAETAIFVPPPRDAVVDIRQPDEGKTLLALGGVVLLAVSIDALLKVLYPYT
jgi:hypothetical protein